MGNVLVSIPSNMAAVISTNAAGILSHVRDALGIRKKEKEENNVSRQGTLNHTGNTGRGAPMPPSPENGRTGTPTPPDPGNGGTQNPSRSTESMEL